MSLVIMLTAEINGTTDTAWYKYNYIIIHTYVTGGVTGIYLFYSHLCYRWIQRLGERSNGYR